MNDKPTLTLLQSAAARRVILALGLSVSIVSLFADSLTGNAQAEIGYKQVLVSLAGLAFAGSSVLLSPIGHRLGARRIRWIVAAYLAACSAVIWYVAPVAGASWILAGLMGAACALLPARFGILTFLSLVTLHLILTLINRIKVDLTGMPLTMLDLRIAVRHPAGLWDALSLPHWTRYAAEGLLLTVLTVWIAVGWQAVAGFMRRYQRDKNLAAGLSKPMALALLVFVTSLYLSGLNAKIGENHRTWHHKWVAELAQQIGIMPFLGYSYIIESVSGGAIYSIAEGVEPPTSFEVEQAVRRYVDFDSHTETAAHILPNIVVVLAESTFDPSHVFHLQGYWNEKLFTANVMTDALGPLRVNTKGGGTWVAEFETITGLDSRFFGYSGAYTHASLSPFVENSFATYLSDHGYETWAFLSTSGAFYNARRAYDNYGFDHVLDSTELGSESEWFGSDQQIVESVISRFEPDPTLPFFSYILLLENHGPHECDDDDQSGFNARFSGTDEFAPNCALNDYLRRLDSTTAAVEILIGNLTAVEERTGRPFVLLLFGDHQPMTFTGSGDLATDFGQYRKTDMYTTFFHILGSAHKRLNCCSTSLPVAVLPTLLSAYVAAAPNDIYLGTNMWLYDRCGADAVQRDFAQNMTSMQANWSAPRDVNCEDDFQRALVAFRNAEVIRLQ